MKTYKDHAADAKFWAEVIQTTLNAVAAVSGALWLVAMALSK